MAIPISLVLRANPRKPKQPRRRHAMPLVVGELSFDELAEEICKLACLKPMDVKSGLRALAVVLPEALLQGKIVRLGDLGTVRLRISDSGCDNIAAFDPAQIRRKRMQFVASAEIRKLLDDADVSFLD